MMIGFFRDLFHYNTLLAEDMPMDAEYELLQDELALAGLTEEELRRMDPDERVTALEQALLDPYDYIHLTCDNMVLYNLPP